MRRRLAAALFTAAAATASAQAAPRDPNAAYKDLVAAYAAGDRAAAVAGIGDLDEDALRAGVESLAGQPPRTLLAAVMLHTDRRLLERRVSSGGDGTAQPVCPESAHARHSLHIVQLLLLVPEGHGFARRWLDAAALQDRLDDCFEEAIRWSDTGAKWFPGDAAILLTRGMIYESVATGQARHAAYGSPFGSRERQAQIDAEVDRSERFRRARIALERAIAVDPALGEARLRLGRVLWRLGKGEQARAVLESVIERGADHPTLHVARMFLGRVHQDAGREDAALREYRAALALQPTSQPAAIALAEALQRAGQPEAARSTVEATLAVAGRRQRPQSIWEYEYGQSRLAPDLLQGLREDIRP